jgi:GntR family transcriptional regulator
MKDSSKGDAEPAPAETRHVTLATALREAISRGDFSPGERLPPERDLAERFDASRTTVRLALSALKSQGLIGSGQGQGTYVRKARPIRVMAMDQDRRARRAANNPATFNAEIAGGIGRQRITSVDCVFATEETARWLAVPEGTELLARRRVMLVDEEPYQLGDSYYIHELVRETAIAREESVEEDVLAVLEQANGRPIAYFVDELSFRMPTPDEATTLRLDPGVCVVRVLRIAYDGDDRPIEAFDQLMAGDKHVLVYKVPAE